MWERGDKTNQGIPELNASSVGMAKVMVLSSLFFLLCIFTALIWFSSLGGWIESNEHIFQKSAASMEFKWHMYPGQLRLQVKDVGFLH